MEYLDNGRISDLTGIPPVTLRAGARRYGLPKPRRTASVSRAVAPICRDGVMEDHSNNLIPSRCDGFRFHLIEGVNHYDTKCA